MAFYIGSDVYAKPAFGKLHPLAISRQQAVRDLVGIMGWLGAGQYVESPVADIETLKGFHDADYVDALKAADSAGKVSREARERYGFGTMENPLFKGVFERASTTVGGSIRAAELALDGCVVFHPSGGTHHGRRDRASGFCYFNDPVFAIRMFLERGVSKVAYVDLDAHHGDGVEAAFADEPRVTLVSIHEEKRWPYSGKLDNRGSENVLNLPVPRGFHDAELAYLMDEIVLPRLAAEKPETLVITCGADALAGDPLSGMELSNNGLWRAVESLVAQTPKAVVLGGGGYNPWTTTRCWAGLWARLAGYDVTADLPDDAKTILASFECDLVDEEDIEPHWLTGFTDPDEARPVRDEVKILATQKPPM